MNQSGEARRGFLSRLTKSAVGLYLITSLPFNLFAKEKEVKKIKVDIHQKAVKRIK